MPTLGWLLAVASATVLPAAMPAQASDTIKITAEQVMIPVRDGAHLQTVIIRPNGFASPLPILLERTPYGIPPLSGTVPIPGGWPPHVKALMADGYILVFQNLRGRFKS